MGAVLLPEYGKPQAGVEFHADARARDAVEDLHMRHATEADWSTEYLALELAVGVVASVQEALAETPPGQPAPSAIAEAARAKAAALVAQMTLNEKVDQLLNVAPAIPRLGVPAYNWWNECLHGVARAGRATVFPEAIGLAATWDTDLMHRIAEAISTEARAKYNEAVRNNDHSRYHGLTFWSPNINIFRDPRWGRGQETYGEDPYLTGRLAVAFIQGMQGNDPHYFKVIATAKHYAVHSGPEPSRHAFDVTPSKYVAAIITERGVARAPYEESLAGLVTRKVAG